MARKALLLLFILILNGCENSPAHRINSCEQSGGSDSFCFAKEFNYEKNNPLPTSQFKDELILNDGYELQNAIKIHPHHRKKIDLSEDVPTEWSIESSSDSMNTVDP